MRCARGEFGIGRSEIDTGEGVLVAGGVLDWSAGRTVKP